MPKKIATLYAEISGDTSKLETSLKGTKDKLSGMKTGLSDAIKGMTGFDIGALGAAAAVAGLAKGMQVSIKAASDMSETVNKTQVVFGKASDQVLKFGDNSASSMGISKQAALEAASTFGNLFVSMDMGQQQSADMSTGLVKLAGDLASFNNIDPGIVLEKLRSGLVGEVEPLRALGVNLTEAAVKAKAMEMGLGGANSELSAADKATARYALILEQTTTAQGDFARTSGGLANQQRILEAQFADTTAELGKNLLPAYLELVKTVNNAAAATNLLLTWQEKVNQAMKTQAANILSTAKTYTEYKTQMDGSNKAANEAIPIWAKFDAWMKGLNADEIALIGTTRTLSQAEWENINTKTNDVGVTRLQIAATNDKNAASVAAAAIAQDEAYATQASANASQRAADAMKDIWLSANGATKASLDFGGAINDLQGATEELKAAQGEWGKSLATDVRAQLEEAGIKGDDLTLAVQTLDNKFGTNFGMRDAYKKAITDIVDQYKQSGSIGTFAGKLDELDKKFEDLSPDVVAAKEKVDDLKLALDQLVARDYTIHVTLDIPNIPSTVNNPNPITTNPRHANPNAGAANGADFIVPPGYPSDSFNLGVTSGEHVQVTRDNKDKASKFEITVNINGNMTDKATAERYARFTADQINRRMK